MPRRITIPVPITRGMCDVISKNVKGTVVRRIGREGYLTPEGLWVQAEYCLQVQLEGGSIVSVFLLYRDLFERYRIGDDIELTVSLMGYGFNAYANSPQTINGHIERKREIPGQWKDGQFVPPRYEIDVHLHGGTQITFPVLSKEEFLTYSQGQGLTFAVMLTPTSLRYLAASDEGAKASG